MNTAQNIQQWTELVIQRDDYTCQYPDCGQNHNLDAAHIISRRQQPTLALYVPNGVTLCRVHHDHLHRHPKEWEEFIAYLFEQRQRGYATVAYA